MTTQLGIIIVPKPGTGYPSVNYGDGLYGQHIYGQSANDSVRARRYRVVPTMRAFVGRQPGGVANMADNDIYITRGDTLPSFVGQIIGDDGLPLDVTGCQVFFNFRPLDEDETLATSGGCVIVAGTDGIIAYDFQPGDTDTPGEHTAEVEVVYPSGRRITVPSTMKLRLHIPDDIVAPI